MAVREDDIAAALVSLRRPRQVQPQRNLDLTKCELAGLASIILLGLAIGATAVLVGPDAGILLSLAILLTSKYGGEVLRLIGFALLGLAAGAAKALQAYADGRPMPTRTAIATIAVSIIFAAAGGVTADAAVPILAPMLGMQPSAAANIAWPAAFICGISTFATVAIIESRFRR